MNLSNRVILPGETIGIIGGGQLGRMMTLAAKANGYNVAVLDPTENSPCGQVADIEIVANYDDMDAIQQLAEVSDIITYEFENIDADCLQWLCENAYVPQGQEILKITQNRISEKEAILKANVEVAPYAVIKSIEDIYENIEKLGFPALLKTATGGYDGKGQLIIREEQDISKGEELVKQGDCVLEKWIPFEKEISVIVVRSSKGEIKEFPVGENIHIDNILHQTIVPARISEADKANAIEKARIIADSLKLVGTLAVEMFLTSDGTIYINELAPRPHNSGHYTIEGCITSQFEQHVRAVCNLPLGSTELLKPTVMVNLLGEHLPPLFDKLPELRDWKVHLYGKKEAKAKRKMGHVTLLRPTIEEALEEIEKSYIWN